mmetsp:Transcript_38841/g.97599  ORF Transcript_38841/g.97599 Transcript_38841/m.97599 type:complete len:478 (-) Transcript_38841:173-1606(-)
MDAATLTACSAVGRNRDGLRLAVQDEFMTELAHAPPLSAGMSNLPASSAFNARHLAGNGNVKAFGLSDAHVKPELVPDCHGEDSLPRTVCSDRSSVVAAPALPPLVEELCCIADNLWVFEAPTKPPVPPSRISRLTRTAAVNPTMLSKIAADVLGVSLPMPAAMAAEPVARGRGQPGAAGADAGIVGACAAAVYPLAAMLQVRAKLANHGYFDNSIAACLPSAKVLQNNFVMQGAEGSSRGWRSRKSPSTSTTVKADVSVPATPAKAVPVGLAASAKTEKVAVPEYLLRTDDDGEIDVESVCSEESSAEEPSTVIVGPTHLAVMPHRLEELWIPTSKGNLNANTPVMIRSNPGQLSLGDTLRLSEARSAQAPLSFGSVLHLCRGDDAPCRLCMFERWAGRCSKKWLCDFCHCHAGQKRSRGGASSPASAAAAAAAAASGIAVPASAPAKTAGKKSNDSMRVAAASTAIGVGSSRRWA